MPFESDNPHNYNNEQQPSEGVFPHRRKAAMITEAYQVRAGSEDPERLRRDKRWCAKQAKRCEEQCMYIEPLSEPRRQRQAVDIVNTMYPSQPLRQEVYQRSYRYIYGEIAFEVSPLEWQIIQGKMQQAAGNEIPLITNPRVLKAANAVFLEMTGMKDNILRRSGTKSYLEYFAIKDRKAAYYKQKLWCDFQDLCDTQLMITLRNKITVYKLECRYQEFHAQDRGKQNFYRGEAIKTEKLQKFFGKFTQIYQANSFNNYYGQASDIADAWAQDVIYTFLDTWTDTHIRKGREVNEAMNQVRQRLGLAALLESVSLA
jgi:hypothetical protein